MGIEKNDGLPHGDPIEEPSEPIYEIRVKGCLDEDFWADWFGGMQFILDPDLAETILRGPISDQAALYGLLTRLRNQGFMLISVQQVR